MSLPPTGDMFFSATVGESDPAELSLWKEPTRAQPKLIEHSPAVEDWPADWYISAHHSLPKPDGAEGAAF